MTISIEETEETEITCNQCGFHLKGTDKFLKNIDIQILSIYVLLPI